ncbi:MAG: hypothetical protein J0I79_13550 [Mesorhizobium sp.]|uniref:hypothetical protein n=1 Tax=Mesorhizobium sp. TaxID=1871066 RepID=UPI001AD29DB9|nr:hypothetical protein [Mesorhizobium sp.]MBN9218972.1 hypothetical protein [Mesorhizobium sp.]
MGPSSTPARLGTPRALVGLIVLSALVVPLSASGTRAQASSAQPGSDCTVSQAGSVCFGEQHSIALDAKGEIDLLNQMWQQGWRGVNPLRNLHHGVIDGNVWEYVGFTWKNTVEYEANPIEKADHISTPEGFTFCGYRIVEISMNNGDLIIVPRDEDILVNFDVKPHGDTFNQTRAWLNFGVQARYYKKLRADAQPPTDCQDAYWRTIPYVSSNITSPPSGRLPAQNEPLTMAILGEGATQGSACGHAEQNARIDAAKTNQTVTGIGACQCTQDDSRQLWVCKLPYAVSR